MDDAFLVRELERSTQLFDEDAAFRRRQWAFVEFIGEAANL